ncbi:PEP-CTERM sorting domain-containing protein [Janthinobacterium sp. BJB412]|nr:PEP-CTERM sorting domain-containing protein [Janthinobacterium sp. BJB412]
MNRTLQQLLRLGVLSAASLAALPAAHAAVIDFENLGIGGVGHNEFFQQAGFDLAGYSAASDALDGDLVGTINDGTDPGSCFNLMCPSSASHYYAGLNDGVLEITRSVPQQTFRLHSFDASFIGATVGGVYPAVAGLLRIQGSFADGSYVYEDYQLAGPGANGFAFGHYTTSAAFGAKQFVAIDLFAFTCNAGGNCNAFQTNKGQFALDNLNVSAVPEPSSWLMLGAGLLGLAAVRRRRAA